jgi:hypothetical protein
MELGLASLIGSEAPSIQCLPNLLAGGATAAILPRIVIKSESVEDQDFTDTPDGVYGVCICAVVVSSIAEATSPTSSAQMQTMNNAVDEIIDDPLLFQTLTLGSLKIYGVVPGDYDQQMLGNTIVRLRMADIYARIQ